VTDIGGVLAFFVSTGVLPALLAGVLVTGVVTVVLRRRGWLDAPAWLAFAAVLSVVGILVFTLFREGVLLAQEVASGSPLALPGGQGLRDWSSDGWWRAAADPLRSTQVLLNIALFVPAGFLWTVLTRRPWRVMLALGALSVVIEVTQALTGLGANDVADIVANAGGAVVGTGAGVITSWVVDVLADRPVSTRRWVLRGAAVAAVVAAVAVLPALGATQRQGVLADEARRQFQGTSLTDIERWQREDEMDRVWRGVPPAYSDGFVQDADSATARYPARFLGRRTCVLVTWDPVGVEVRSASGATCARPSL
jgi:hypothetical protein